jgi:hypothetical protein
VGHSRKGRDISFCLDITRRDGWLGWEDSNSGRHRPSLQSAQLKANGRSFIPGDKAGAARALS